MQTDRRRNQPVYCTPPNISTSYRYLSHVAPWVSSGAQSHQYKRTLCTTNCPLVQSYIVTNMLPENFCNSLDTLTDEAGFLRRTSSFLLVIQGIMPLDIMSDDQGASRQTCLKIVGHVRRDQRILGSLNQ